MEVKDIKKVSVIGSGVIGSSWALAFAMNNLEVGVYDLLQEGLELAKQRVHSSLESLVKNEVVDETKIAQIEKKISYTTSMEEALKESLFIVEAGPEKYEIKWSIVEEIEKYADEKAIISSSTSGLLITQIAKNAKHPERFIGGHPYNPPHLIPLVEITKGEKTSKENIKIAYDFYKSIKKEPVILQKEALGFICNRIQMAVYREVCELVMRGVCSIEDADKAVTYGPGIRWAIMGPSLVFELGGGQAHVDGLMNHVNSSINLWLNDMADWKEFPKEFPKIAREGVEESLKNRPQEIGNDDRSLAEYRDKMLIEILKLHKKI